MNIIFIDIESTGLSISGSEILTLSAIKCKFIERKLEEISRISLKFKTVANLERYHDAIKIHGIRMQESAYFPNREESLLRFFDWCDLDNIFSCHANKNQITGNYSFDYAILQQLSFDLSMIDEFRKSFYPCRSLSTHTLCQEADRDGVIQVKSTLKEGNKRASKSYSLDNMSKLFGIKLTHHNADSDVEACMNIFRKISVSNPLWLEEKVNNWVEYGDFKRYDLQ
jgi:DNA polymerase III epsilon subunit-like protein